MLFGTCDCFGDIADAELIDGSGVAGLFPYIGTAGATIFMAREASVASQGEQDIEPNRNNH